MKNRERFGIGADVHCSDGTCGQLARVVIDPVAKAVTHLVIDPKHPSGPAKLVPVHLVDEKPGSGQPGSGQPGAGQPDGIVLRCSRSQMSDMDDAEEAQFLPGTSPEWGYGTGRVLLWAYYGLELGVEGIGGPVAQPVLYDKVPPGEVQVRRGDTVQAADGPIGRVEGMVVDPADHHVTHVLLQKGHLWGQRQVAIPITAVADMGDAIRLSITRDQVRQLPEVPLGELP